jgi:glyoxylase-like metal-dependent hydrolase (beta-lactamase superfamily II)
LQQNCTLVWCRKTLKAAIIDPGASVDALLGAVAKQGLTLEAIWITHGHLDHAGGAAEMQEKTGLDIIGPHPADQFWIEGIPQQGQMYGLPDARSFTPTRWLADGDALTLGETTWEVRHCPGHTPGHGPSSTFGAERRSNPFVSDEAMRRAPIARPPTGPS